MADYDYAIVGGGSAGCVLAARLTEASDVRVLLLEAGPTDRNPFIHWPIGFYRMASGSLTWGLKTAPQEHAQGREMAYPQARVLGGGSSINAQVFTRGCPQDYDAWAEEFGCAGWRFAEIQPYFLRSEDNDRLAGDWHGVGGPQGVTTPVPQPLTQAFVRACQQLGMPHNADFNGPRQEGAGAYQITVRNARRCSAAVGYLRPVRRRRNLTLKTDATVTRIVVEHGRAIGVEYAKDGKSEMVRIEREVILAAGAIGSPKLMMLSGLGPADHLRSHGIEVAADLPGVGRNLHDHFGIDIVYELKGADSLDRYGKLHWMVLAALQYFLLKKGPMLSNIVEGGAFWYADRAAPTPDLQFHFLAGSGVDAGVPAIASGSGCTLNSYMLRPRARGWVELRDADPTHPPVINPNFLADPHDIETSTAGLSISRDIMRQSAIQRFVKREHFPGDRVRSRAELEQYARRHGRTAYHPAGTCRMGVDEMAVVDPALRVRGIDGLRICDSSIMPRLVSSNTNAPTIMIAEKAADLVLDKPI